MMKNIFVLIFLLVISNQAFSQKMISPVAHTLKSHNFLQPLSFEGFISKNHDACLKRISDEIAHLKASQDKDFLKYTQDIGSKLKQADDRCKYFRFEFTDFRNETAQVSKQFAFRCYTTQATQLPYQRVSGTEVQSLNPGIDYNNSKVIEKNCNALSIIKMLADKPVKSIKKSQVDSPDETEKTADQSTKKSHQRNIQNHKFGSGQN